MRVERRPYEFDILAEFPNARLFKMWEGGGAFKAERDGKPFIISDARTLADDVEYTVELGLVNRETALDGLVSVVEFEDEAERAAYVAREMAFGSDVEACAD